MKLPLAMGDRVGAVLHIPFTFRHSNLRDIDSAVKKGGRHKAGPKCGFAGHGRNMQQSKRV